jgi:hypothetical protein
MNEDSGGNGPEISLVENLSNGAFSYDVRQNVLEWPSWPAELSDPMAWSAQFIDPLQNSQPSRHLVSSNPIPLSQFSGHPVSSPEASLYIQIEDGT